VQYRQPNVGKNSGSSQSLAYLLRLTEPTNQSTNMSTALNNNSNRSKVPGTVAISDDEMRRFAPIVFASQPIESVSERYSFLPTSSILNGMRENGWVPVRAQEQSIWTEARRGFQKHEQLALATGAAAYRWEDLTKAPVSPSMLLNPRRYGNGAKDLWTTLNCVQENIIRGG
jgi:hypothetical protein